MGNFVYQKSIASQRNKIMPKECKHVYYLRIKNPNARAMDKYCKME